MSAQVSKQIPKYVKCLKASHRRLVKDKVYEVVQAEYDEYYLRDGKTDIGWYLSSGFEVMPPTYDHEEVKMRLWLVTPVQPCSCKKCGAPVPCSYHP